jgi:hypothetical protein
MTMKLNANRAKLVGMAAHKARELHATPGLLLLGPDYNYMRSTWYWMYGQLRAAVNDDWESIPKHSAVCASFIYQQTAQVIG